MNKIFFCILNPTFNPFAMVKHARTGSAKPAPLAQPTQLQTFIRELFNAFVIWSILLPLMQYILLQSVLTEFTATMGGVVRLIEITIAEILATSLVTALAIHFKLHL